MRKGCIRLWLVGLLGLVLGVGGGGVVGGAGCWGRCGWIVGLPVDGGAGGAV